MKDLKIILYTPSPQGGFATYSLSLIKGLNNYVSDVVLLTSTNFDTLNCVSNSKSIIPILKPIHPLLGWKRCYWLFNRPFIHLSRYVTLTRYIIRCKTKNKVVHMQENFALLSIVFVPFLKKLCPFVLTVHDVEPHGYRFSSLKLVEQAFLGQSFKVFNRLIVHTESNKKRLCSLYSIEPQKVMVIQHGIPYMPEKGLTTTEEGKVVETLFLFFGTIRANKGLLELIEAVSILKVNCKTFKVVVLGSVVDQGYINECKELVSDLLVQEYVEFNLGFIEEEMVQYYFRRADVIILPYKNFEAQSGVLFQAYFAKKPVIVTNCGSLEETVRQDNTGLVAEAGNVKDLASKMYEFIMNQEIICSNCQEAYRRLNESKKYSWSTIGQITLNLYLSMINGEV